MVMLLWISRFLVRVMCYVSRYFMGGRFMVCENCLKKVEWDSVVFLVSVFIVYVCVGVVCISCKFMVIWVLVSLCSRLGGVVFFVVECSVLISSSFISWVSISLWFGCVLSDFFWISFIRIDRCLMLCMCSNIGSSDISNVVLGELNLK